MNGNATIEFGQVPKNSGRRPRVRLSYWQHAEATSGIEVNEDKWLASRCEAAELERQTETIAERLRSFGVPCERPQADEMSLVGVCSGQSVTLKPWRHINFLPSVASSNRRQLVRRLSYFSESRPYLRYLVMTNGARCKIGELRPRLQSLSRSISKYAALPQLKAWGITVELRVCEVTAERGPDGEFTYHPHANVIINCSRKIDWQEFLAFTTANTDGHWRDNGRMIDSAEAIKYFVKPAEVLEHRASELAELFLATFGLRLVAPMGAFRLFTLEMKTERIKLAKKIGRDGASWQWCFVKMAEPSAKVKAKSKMDDRVMALMSPQPRFVPRFEPCVLVRNFTGDVSRVLEVNRLGELFETIIAAFRNRSIRFTPPPQLSQDFRPNSEAGHRKRKTQAGRDYILAQKT